MFLTTALILGVLGSLHCAGMCGPIALSLPSSSRSYSGFVTERLAYNLGRTTTYAALGAFFGLIGKSIWVAGFQQALSLTLGILILLAITPGALRLKSKQVPWTGLVDKVKRTLASQIQQRGLPALFVIGVLNGLLPCGLVYTAAAGATATTNPMHGALYMTLFGLGTIPLLLFVSWTGHALPWSLRLRWQRWIPVSMLLLGGLLVIRGLGLNIPYLSPELHGAEIACSHCKP